MSLTRSLLPLVCACLPLTLPAADLFGVQFRAFSGQFQLFLDIEANGSVSRDGPLFSPAGGIFGATFIDGTFYASEFENASGNYFLATIPHTGNATGARVGATAIGFSNVEALAWCPVTETLYGASFDFPSHITTILTIDPATGVGTAVGTLPFDVWIVGMACSPDGTLYGATAPFGADVFFSVPRLYEIQTSPGIAGVHIGALGTARPLQSLTWDGANERLGGAFEALHAIDTMTGAATLIGGDFTTDTEGDGIYGLGSINPGDPPDPVPPDIWSLR